MGDGGGAETLGYRVVEVGRVGSLALGVGEKLGGVEWLSTHVR